MTPLTTSLILNLCLLIACAFALSLTYRAWPRRHPAVLWLRLGLTAAATWALGYFSTEIGGFRIDLRYVPIAMVTLGYGPLWGALVGAPTLLWRLVFENSPGIAPVVWLHFISVLVLSGLLRPHLRPMLERLEARHLWLAPLPFLGVGLGLLLSAQGRELFWVSYPLRVGLSGLGLVAALGIIQARLRLLDLARTLQAQADTDALTGLPNRRRFEADLAALRPGEHLALLDLDHFKLVNDRYGHDGGDRALEQVAGLMRGYAPEVQPYRVGGEEFGVLVRGLPDRDAAEAVGSLRAALPGQSGGWTGETGARLTLSAGLATLQPGEDAASLFRRADEALYLAKTNGRDRLVVWAADLFPAVPSPAAPAPAAPPLLQPRHSVWQGLRTTVELLAQRRVLRDEDWQEVLRLAVDAVDGAGCGTLDIREGRGFRMTAAVGYSASLVGLRLTQDSQQRWYGRSLADWRAGVPRLVEGEALAKAYAVSNTGLPTTESQLLSAVGRRGEVTGNLCLPVVLGDEVVAHLNLDSLAGGRGFGPGSVEVARLFAQQMAALLHLQERWAELERLVTLHEQVSAAEGEQKLEEELTAAASDLLRARQTALLRYDPATDTLVSGVHGPSEAPLERLHRPRGQGLSWAALEAGAVRRVADTSHDPRVSHREGLLPGAMMAVPLFSADGSVLGSLIFAREPEQPFSDADEHLGLLLASLTARHLERAANVRNLCSTLDVALETLGEAAERRDYGEQPHVRRVMELARVLGEALDLSPEELRGLNQGAALHDLGKVALPEALLRRPGPLSAEERALMETHPARGVELAARMDFLHPYAGAVIRSHHERWDGQGYPDGLAGEDIPLPARMVALCDVYDALTSDRPHRAALTPAEALGRIADGRGTHFDPALTDTFLNLHGQGAFANRAQEGQRVGRS